MKKVVTAAIAVIIVGVKVIINCIFIHSKIVNVLIGLLGFFL